MDGAKLLSADAVILPAVRDYLKVSNAGNGNGKPGTITPPKREDGQMPKRKLPSFL
jgi:hypothetical protein